MLNVSEKRFVVFYKAVTGIKPAFRGDTKVAPTRPTRVRPMRTLMNLLNCSSEVSEGISFAVDGATLELFSTIDHLFEHFLKIVPVHLLASRGSVQHGRKADTVKAQAQELIQCLPQTKVTGRDSHARRDLHAFLHL